MRSVYIIIPGIFSFKTPRQALMGRQKWPAKAKTWIGSYTPHKSDLFLYTVGAFTRILYTRKRAENLAGVLKIWLKAGYRVNLICHSNAGNALNNALEHIPGSLLTANPIHRVYLISSALGGHFGNTRIYHDFARNRIRFLDLWVAGKDLPLKLARTPLGRLLGYAPTGAMDSGLWSAFTGTRGSYRYEAEYGHGTWFRDEHLTETLETITGEG